MKLSVIIPVYNAEKYLSECVGSVVKQTFQDMEVILVDDGSTDSSAAICDSYAQKYDFVFVIHQDNQGISSARNAGIAAARGEYIAFVDSDDVLDWDMYEILIDALEATGSDVAACGFAKEFSEIMAVEKQNAVPPVCCEW